MRKWPKDVGMETGGVGHRYGTISKVNVLGLRLRAGIRMSLGLKGIQNPATATDCDRCQ